MNEIIVSGGDLLTSTIADELKNAGAKVVRLADTGVVDTETALATAGVARAFAVVCTGDDDATNLEIALLARKANPNVRVVARLANDVLREAVADGNGPGAILNVAELAAPSIIKACLAQTEQRIEAVGIQFVVSGSFVLGGMRVAPGSDLDGVHLFGLSSHILAIAIARPNAPVKLHPPRDVRLNAGDTVYLVGPYRELLDTLGRGQSSAEPPAAAAG